MKTWSKYIKPYLRYFILGPLCMIVEVIGEVLMPQCLAAMITNAATNGWLYAIKVSGLMVLIALTMMAGGIGGAYFGTRASVNFAADLRLDIYKKVQKFSFANVDKFSTGSLVTRLTNDVTQMQNMINMLLRMALRAPGMLIGALIMAIAMRPSLAAILGVTLPLMIITIGIVIKITFPRFSAVQGKIDRLNSTVQENITNMRVVKSFVRENHENDKFFVANKDLKSTQFGAMKILIWMSPIMSIFMNLTTIAVLWFGSQQVYQHGMEIGDLSAFVGYVMQILFSLVMVSMLFMMLSRALASAKRIKEVLNEEIDIVDDNASSKDAVVNDGKIEFKNVTFRYHKNSEDPVLDNINITINPKSTVGIIGSTGSGKTTLVSLIARLYDTDEGEILVDGINVKDYSLFNLREGVGMVLQKNVLFSGSIEDNLRWGDEEATDEMIANACKSAQADKFIENFKGQYQYDLGQGGKNVSGGQKQRLCIARALLKKPKILILDDSTSAVDTATEAMIRNAFANELADCTKIIIAQRISSVKDADSIIVIDNGKIVGVGTHDELMETNEEYKEIYYSQNEKAKQAAEVKAGDING
ncbi:MAG: ABC transporter ATP-binding protein/permease [Clostridia bacterium]|nr:ABC transporter ATP-binding protein/permease [Clostridia bacterium]